jgi:bacteriocin biosynthesis cyclodehydratase domain-containing protein
MGAFGAAVAAELAAAVAPVATRTGSGAPPDADAVAAVSAVAVVAGRPVPAIAERVDELAFQTRVPWLPILIESGVLRIGPVIVPGFGACYRCFRHRLRQHAAAPPVEAALDRHYRTSTADEPYGHLPGTAVLAAVVAAGILARTAADPVGEAGRVRQRDLATGRLTDGRVVGVHGCPRCGLHRDERGRSSTDLFRAMSEALQWTG